VEACRKVLGTALSRRAAVSAGQRLGEPGFREQVIRHLPDAKSKKAVSGLQRPEPAPPAKFPLDIDDILAGVVSHPLDHRCGFSQERGDGFGLATHLEQRSQPKKIRGDVAQPSPDSVAEKPLSLAT
jgi:hypothetical protein